MPRVKILDHLGAALRQIVEWGFEFSRATPGVLSDRRVEVSLAKGSQSILVGTLRQEEGEFVFEYSPAFKAQDELPPISAFPEKGCVYRSSALWPFFAVRLPPMDRKDVQSIIAEKKIPTHDVLRLVAELAGKSPTSPYELRYVERVESTRPSRPEFTPVAS